ncbi:nucleotidyl transferase AbiEii/AbiGii toxin family protein [Chthonomonas calidirosea]|uniref:nucleotidyl transferase AbiEii/AbiGii toxin family protein n=1 Tax=Chthonomonas calidirosea TaxID=454171 RepID=UPI000698DF7E|nr:nucleotidyl transferase AbiEii/AbiGii toxin family protein [Chthonomonas calidirosea]
MLQRIRRQLSFDRLLARLFAVQTEAPWVLKGGYALELRFRSARSTKDNDLTLRSGLLPTDASGTQRDRLRRRLQQSASIDLADFFEFFVQPATLDLEGAPVGGLRYPVEAVMDGRIFAKFHVDIGIGDEVADSQEVIEGGDWLAFSGIPRPQFLSIPCEQQWAEKFHAYTRPRLDRMNSRAKDLIDLAATQPAQ